jgi:sulfur carrier protein
VDETAIETIHVNGAREVMTAKTLRALLDAKGIDAEGRGLAVALNGSVVPRARWNDTALRAGDAVEIVQAKQGG